MKRKIAAIHTLTDDTLKSWAAEAGYGGNPQHKKRPADYQLHPPTSPRPHKTLCDADRVFRKAEAEDLLRKGLLRGMVSIQTRNGWPQNVWSVLDEAEPFEAELENPEQGIYHGYPMPLADTFREEVLREWANRKK